ncbi:MAG: hypothetical protein HRU33_12530 [Rhodobacteraceae bacterium]|nr:hypothetical protein [Paracoccaceae bacterium]
MLHIARAEFLREVQPILPEDLKYKALMIANAMAIAQRQFHGSSEMSAIEVRQITALLTDTPDDVHATLCQKIREGIFDPGSDNHCQMLDVLTSITLSRLAESNPKFLEKHADTLPNGAIPT